MTIKNWDNVRENRLYGYLNQKEMDKFLEAMRIQDMQQQATAVRQFVVDRADQIIVEHRQKQFKQQQVVVPTVTYSFPGGTNTANKFIKY